MNLEKLKLEFLEKEKLFEELRDVIIYKIQSEIKSNKNTPIKYFRTRIKTFERFQKKVDDEGIEDISEAFSIIHDILGVRLICLYKTELPEICDWVKENFEILDEEVFLWDGVGDLTPTKEEFERTKETGYTSIHYTTKIKESQKRGTFDLCELTFEIQVRTVLGEAWGEFTHEVYRDANAPKIIVDSYKILSEYLDLTNKQVEFLKTSYKTLTKDQIEKGTIESVNYQNEEIKFMNLSDYTLRNLKYVDCTLFAFKLTNSYLYNIEYNRCSLMSFDFAGAELKRVKFLNKGLGRHLMNLKFISSTIRNSDFKTLDMMNTDFSNVICRNTDFEDVQFMNTDFFNAEFTKCTFKNVSFINVFNVESSNFIECTFDKINAEGENCEKLKERINVRT